MIMKKRFVIQFLCAFCLTVSFGYARGDIISTFDVDDEGWSVVEFPGPPYDMFVIPSFSPSYLSTEGNPEGAISTSDQNANLFLFSAPSLFLGGMESFYGGKLSYDLRFIDNGLSPGLHHPDVVLWGNDDVLIIDYFLDPSSQAGSWESYSIPLTEAAGWRFDDLSGALASEGQIRKVLGNLTGLYIRGDYWDGLERSDLDNPRLTPIPLPATGLLFLMSVPRLVITRRHRKALA